MERRADTECERGELEKENWATKVRREKIEQKRRVLILRELEE